jgi:hypothetical protein
MDEKGNDAMDMDDDAPEQDTSGQDVQKPEQKGYVADKPRERVSLKEKLEAMKVKASGRDTQKPDIKKDKGKEEVI